MSASALRDLARPADEAVVFVRPSGGVAGGVKTCSAFADCVGSCNSQGFLGNLGVNLIPPSLCACLVQTLPSPLPARRCADLRPASSSFEKYLKPLQGFTTCPLLVMVSLSSVYICILQYFPTYLECHVIELGTGSIIAYI